MPRHHLSYEDAEIESLLQRLENTSDRHCRTLLWLLIKDGNGEVREACDRVLDPPKEGELTTYTYLDTDIHHMIVAGYAKRSNIETHIEESKNLGVETQVVLLVELGTDLVTHRFRWSATDLDILHAKIQDGLMELLKEDIRMVNIVWSRMDELVRDDDRYSTLAAKLDQDKRDGVEGADVGKSSRYRNRW
jgi:hypothetical protein